MEEKEYAIDLIKYYLEQISGVPKKIILNLYKEDAHVKTAKQCAIIDIKGKIKLLETLAKPERVAFLTNNIFKIDGQEYETHAHGYDLVGYFENVLICIDEL